jgi:hypothetical protein
VEDEREVLIEILTSARPLHQALQRRLQRKQDRQQHEEVPALDPHKRVDTSGFLLQRTRRVSDALRALRQRLERPVVSEQALAWRLRGPVGVLALAQAIGNEAHTDEERCYLLIIGIQSENSSGHDVLHGALHQILIQEHAQVSFVPVLSRIYNSI